MLSHACQEINSTGFEALFRRRIGRNGIFIANNGKNPGLQWFNSRVFGYSSGYRLLGKKG